MKRPLTREQMSTILQGLLALVLFVLVLQLWLLTATLNAYLGEDDAVLVPAALASLACCGVNCLLLRYLSGLERPVPVAASSAR
jgi:hypothetical protein